LRDFRLAHAIQRRYVLVAIVQVHRGPGACRIDADPRRDPVLLLCALACDQRDRLHAAAADRRGTAAALRIVIGLLPASSCARLPVLAGFAPEATALCGPIREP
jgi:hypothetical protein